MTNMYREARTRKGVAYQLIRKGSKNKRNLDVEGSLTVVNKGRETKTRWDYKKLKKNVENRK